MANSSGVTHRETVCACLGSVLDTLRELRGVHLWGYRIGSLKNYIEQRLVDLGLESYGSYAAYLRRNRDECDALLDALLVSSSCFFRGGLAFCVLAEVVLPCLLDAKRTSATELRVWSAGCSAGEELYSLAILLGDYMQVSGKEPQCFLLGTDINQTALERAGQGRYSRESLRHVPLRFVDTYFEQRDNTYELLPKIRAMGHFCLDDILNQERMAPVDSIFGSFDLILCRNVLMYYDLARQEAIITKLENCLNRNGYLILGDCETLAAKFISKFIPVLGRQFILQKK